MGLVQQAIFTKQSGGRMRGMTTRRKFTSAGQSALNNIKAYATRTEMHGQAYKQAVERGDIKAMADQAYWLLHWAKQATSAGNLILNQGKTVALVIAEVEEEMRNSRRKTDSCDQCGVPLYPRTLPEMLCRTCADRQEARDGN